MDSFTFWHFILIITILEIALKMLRQYICGWIVIFIECELFCHLSAIIVLSQTRQRLQKFIYVFLSTHGSVRFFYD